MRSILYLILSSLLLLGSCGKFSTKEHYTLDANFKSFFNYRNGSEWHYFDLADTNYKEVVTVTGHLQGKMVWDAFDQEFIQYDLISDKDSLYKLRAVAEAVNVSRAVLLVQDTNYRQAAEWYYAGGNFSGVAGNGDTFNFYPTYRMQARDYTDVIELIPRRPRLDKRIFIARGIGIIRKEKVSGRTLVLKSWTVQ